MGPLGRCGCGRKDLFPRIFDYAGEGEWELLHSVGLSRKELGQTYDFPRVHAECHFKKALALGAHFTLRFWPGKLGRTSIRYNFEDFSGRGAG